MPTPIQHTRSGYGFNGTDFVMFAGSGAPVDGTTGLQHGAGKGSIYVDLTNANIYINSGTKTASVWKLVTRAA